MDLGEISKIQVGTFGEVWCEIAFFFNQIKEIVDARKRGMQKLEPLSWYKITGEVLFFGILSKQEVSEITRVLKSLIPGLIVEEKLEDPQYAEVGD